MFFVRSTVMGILSAKFRKYDTLRTINYQRPLLLTKCDKFFLLVILIIVWCINVSNSWIHQQQQSYGGHFVGEEEAEAIAIEANMRLAKIPCNFTTKTNCIYAEALKMTLPFKENNEIVVSWVPQIGILNRSDLGMNRDTSYPSYNINRNIDSNGIKDDIRKKSQNDFYNFNWIFELLACMMLASAFEICLLILRNLRNISLAFCGFWSSLNLRLQMILVGASTPVNKSDNLRKRSGNIEEKRTLSYLFAILTWRASQTAKGGTTNTEAHLRDENTSNAISYGHVTTMGDLLLLILFTHVYYQRQKFHQGPEDKSNTEREDLLDGHKEKVQKNTAYNKLYDKQISNSNDSNHNRRGFSKRCSYFCGNMYQQISSLQENHASAQVKLAPLTTYTTKIPYLTYCTGIVWYTCCFCQYSCCYCCSNCRRWNQRCYIYIPPLCNTIYCCCFHKSLKSFYDVNYQYSCYLCCWQDMCRYTFLDPHITCHCCCNFYCDRLHNHCYFCTTLTSNKSSSNSQALNLLLLNATKSFSSNAYRHSVTEYCIWKLKCNNQNYSILYEVDGHKYSLLYLADGRSMCVYKRNYYQVAVEVFSYLLPQYLLTIKNCQTFLKWKKLHVAVVIMALIVICASSAGANCDHHHYYSSLFNRCHKHFSKCKKKNKKRCTRRRRRHQHCKAYRTQHYFYTTLLSCVKRQKNKNIQKKLVNKIYKKSAKLLTSHIIAYEYNLTSTTSAAAATITATRTSMVRTIKRVRGSKPNIVWLIIGLIWFEGPKIVNCNVIINYQNQQQHEQQQQQQQQYQQTGNNHKETITTSNSVNSNFDYKMENLNQIKAKNGNNNSNSNNNDNNSNNSSSNNKNKNKNTSNNSNNNNDSSNTNNSRSSTTATTTNNIKNNIHLSVNLIPIINTIHFKHYCNSNYHQKLIRSSQRVQRALKTNPKNLDTSINTSASLNYNNINDDFDTEQLSSTSSFQNINEENHAQSDLMRLESIKHQILFKLGLTGKPNVSHPLPKQFIWDTIYRADGIKSFHEFSNTNNFQDHQHFMPQQNNPHWTAMPSTKGSNVVPLIYKQKINRVKGDMGEIEEGIDNIKVSVENINVGHRKYGKNKQHHTLPKHYSNDVNYPKTATTSMNINQLLYTSNRNKLNNTNKTVNNFTILKQFKHQQFHKNSLHSTSTGKKTTTIHQQQNRRRQHKQYTNSNNNIQVNNKSNNNNNNKNNNNVNNSNNIMVVQKHIRNSNNFNEDEDETKKFTYLTDINSSDDSLNSMEYHNSDIDDNNSIVRKQQQLLQKQHNGILNEKTSENYHNIKIDTNDDNNGAGDLDIDMNADHNINHDDDDDGLNDEDDGDDDHYHHNHENRHENYFPKFDAFDESDDFFGSTQEIITFAEKGKMYKNHRLVEFSHQNNEKPKQKLRVRNAEIHIRIDKISIKNKSRAGSGIKRKRLKIWIFQLIENNYTYKGFDHVAQFCASFEVDTSRLGWKKFDITSTVKEWYSRRESEKLRLLIDCTGCGKMYTVQLFNTNNAKTNVNIRERRIADGRRTANMNDINNRPFLNVTPNYRNYTNFAYNRTIMYNESNNIARRNIDNINTANPDEEDLMNSSRPFLVLHTEARKQRRVRRRAINCNGALHGQCCKESFYVSFKALGWDDWIIAPRGYFANYCRGDCTGPYRTPDTFQTFHAHFIEEYRKMGLLNGMQPCCAPIKFSSMSLIYYGDEGIIKRDLPKMVVDECGCP
ncbi:inhibin subunit beta isoform 1-T7 [Cochliomyia hominivorax]